MLAGLVQRCMKILASEAGKDASRQIRVIELLKTLIHETEAFGAGDVQPHGALLRGEALEPLRIGNRATRSGGELSVAVYSNTTLWELKREVALLLDFTPRFLQMSLGTGAQLTDFKTTDNGKTMKALGLHGGEALTALRAVPEEYIPAAALIDAQGRLVPAAARLFSQWFEMFCDPEERVLTKERTAPFV